MSVLFRFQRGKLAHQASMRGAILHAHDPGKRESGVACFCGGVLSLAGLYASDPSYPDPDFTVCELMEFANARGKGNANKLIEVQAAAAARFGDLSQADLYYVKPSWWKGQESKGDTKRKVYAVLSGGERETLDWRTAKLGAKAHNVVDAVALGLWALRRI